MQQIISVVDRRNEPGLVPPAVLDRGKVAGKRPMDPGKPRPHEGGYQMCQY
jgi:hypothetical protein